MNTQPREVAIREIAQLAPHQVALEGLAERYRLDGNLRSRLDSGDVADALTGIGFPPPPPGVKVRVAVNTADTYHVVLPPDPNVALSDESLTAVAGGKSASTAGSAGTASSIGTVCGTASSAGTASSVASAGSAT